MFLRNILATDFGCGMTPALLLAIILFNNIVCNPKEENGKYCLNVRLPRKVFGIMLLFPSRNLDYKVPLYIFISQCVIYLTVITLSVLSLLDVTVFSTEICERHFLQGISIAEFVLLILCVIDNTIWRKKHKFDL